MSSENLGLWTEERRMVETMHWAWALDFGLSYFGPRSFWAQFSWARVLVGLGLVIVFPFPVSLIDWGEKWALEVLLIEARNRTTSIVLQRLLTFH